MFDTIIEGTRYVLDLAKEKKVKSFLFTSSGAVYGKQPSEMTHISEDYMGAPNCQDPSSAYGEGKRVGELLSAIYFKQFGVPVKIARCFAFVGPYLPLDAHFAIGNFILNALKGENILIKGDGTPHRSYLYAADLIIWLFNLLLKGENNLAYNIGSHEDYSIKDIAIKVKQSRTPGKITPGKIIVLKEHDITKPSERYVPNINLIKHKVGVNIYFNIQDSISKSIKFYE